MGDEGEVEWAVAEGEVPDTKSQDDGVVPEDGDVDAATSANERGTGVPSMSVGVAMAISPGVVSGCFPLAGVLPPPGGGEEGSEWPR